MGDQTKVVVSTKVPVWFRREIGVRAAKRGETISEYVYHLLKLAQSQIWLAPPPGCSRLGFYGA